MGLNIAGLAGAINGIDTLSLHSTNPGLGLFPVDGTELTDSPYSRQSCSFLPAVDESGSAVYYLSTDVTFNLNLLNDQNCQFIGLWTGSTYKGYVVPSAPFNFTDEQGTPVERSFTALAATTKITLSNQA